MPNESFKWDFILDKYAAEDDAKQKTASRRRMAKRGDYGFNKDYNAACKKTKLA